MVFCHEYEMCKLKIGITYLIYAASPDFVSSVKRTKKRKETSLRP
jgi:hypothetical protein